MHSGEAICICLRIGMGWNGKALALPTTLPQQAYGLKQPE